MKVLIVDDDVDSLDITAYALRRAGYEVVTAVEGRQAIQRWEAEHPDLVVLDVRLPKISGFEICRHIRAASNVPIIMLTGCDEDEDVVRGFDLGADDYIVKPFSHRQLVARVRRTLQRVGTPATATRQQQLAAGDMVLDVDSHEVIRDGRSIRLTPLEFRLFHCLVSNAGRVVSTDKLIEYVWGYRDSGDPNLLKTHVCHIRGKLGLSSGKSGYIKNVPGAGYTLLQSPPLAQVP